MAVRCLVRRSKGYISQCNSFGYIEILKRARVDFKFDPCPFVFS